MDRTEIKHVLEAALLAAGRPLTLDKLRELFAAKGELERAALKEALDELAADYEGRGIELKEVASGYRIQVRSAISDWLIPLWAERSPRYTRALLETLALVAYRQPITRGEIEDVRGVAVSTNIIRTLLERGWIRVVGHRDVPGKPAMFGTTREFLDYFGLKKLDDLPPLAELKDWSPEESPQTDLAFDPEQAPVQASAHPGHEGEEVASTEIGDDGATEDTPADVEALSAEAADKVEEPSAEIVNASSGEAPDDPSAEASDDPAAAEEPSEEPPVQAFQEPAAEEVRAPLGDVAVDPSAEVSDVPPETLAEEPFMQEARAPSAEAPETPVPDTAERHDIEAVPEAPEAAEALSSEEASGDAEPPTAVPDSVAAQTEEETHSAAGADDEPGTHSEDDWSGQVVRLPRSEPH